MDCQLILVKESDQCDIRQSIASLQGMQQGCGSHMYTYGTYIEQDKGHVYG